MKRVLITGGAGFIGSHLADRLLADRYAVRLLDNLSPQVHGADRQVPAYLNRDAELIVGDVCDAEVVRQALEGVDVVVHLAAKVGVGQSMYAIAEYTETNNLGTAVLLEALSKRPVERLVVASSMSLYGEGLCRDQDGRIVGEAARSLEQLKAGQWELTDSRGQALTPLPTPESKRPSLASIYALSKYDQECLCLITGRAYGIPTVALRLFNVYGPRQALSNPYTGVLAIFASRLANDHRPLLFEDGLQQRDFVNVADVAEAFRLALTAPKAPGGVYNIASGNAYTVFGLAERMARALGKPELTPEVTGRYRAGDIRHCIADISAARATLGYSPRVDLETGIRELAGWLDGQVAIDRVAEASEELSARGLTL